MKSISLLLSWRYLRALQYEKNISTMATISFIGIMVGTICLTLVACIMRGFERATYQTLQGSHATFTMESHGNQLAFEAIEKIVQKEFPHLYCSPSDIQYIMVQDHAGTLSNLVALRGIDADKEVYTAQLEKKIIDSIIPDQKTFHATLNKSVLIGHQLARILNVTSGDTIPIFFVPDHEQDNKKITLEQLELTIGGIFKTGIEEFDANLIICSLEQLQSIFPQSGITAIHFTPKQSSDEKIIQEQLKKRFHLPVYSWKDRYPALVAALTLEKYASIIVLTLIIIIASMTILSLLFMHIFQKRSDIAILKITGASTQQIRALFFNMGIFITLSALVIGLIIAFLLGVALQHYIIIELPDAYFVTNLPIALEPSIFGMVFLIVLCISMCATWLATCAAHTINIADVLRFER